jgi:uncharacterized membrane protein YgaE (UPF0421/DUF939 family)
MSDDLENDLDSLLLKYHSKSANYSERRMFVNFAHAHEEELKDSKVQIEIVKRIFTHFNTIDKSEKSSLEARQFIRFIYTACQDLSITGVIQFDGNENMSYM